MALIAAIGACSKSEDSTENTRHAITLPGGFVEESIGGGWNQPTGITFASDGRMFVWEKGGRVWRMDADGHRISTPFLDLAEEVGDWRDYGLVGFALHPNFLNNGYVYALYVVDYHHLKYFGTASYNPNANEYFKDTIGRVVRYQARAADGFTSIDLATRSVLLGETMQTGCPILHQSHGVGSLAFGKDGTLLVSCGDGASYDGTDFGGPITGSSNTALADGIIRAAEDVGAFRAQMVNSLSGKVLRIDPTTGDGIPSNPFYLAGAPRAARSRVWALGFRNPYKITFRPETGSHDPADGDPGVLYVGDVGWNNFEELSPVTTGGQNFGWPLYEGLNWNGAYQDANIENKDAPNPLNGMGGCSRPFFRFDELLAQDSLNPRSYPNPCNAAIQIPAGVPVFEHVRPQIDWKHSDAETRVASYNAAGDEIAPRLSDPGVPVSGAEFNGNASVAGVWYTGTDFPPEYQNTFFQADYGQGWIRNFVFDASNKLTQIREFAPAGGAIVNAIATHPVNGNLYYLDYPSAVRRIRYVGGGNRPPTAVATSDKTYGASPLVVQFTGDTSRDPELGPLSYSWNFGDGSPASTQANPSHTFTAASSAAQAFLVRLTVTDSAGATSTSDITIVANDTPPQVTIVSPLDGGVFRLDSPTNLPLDVTVTDAEQLPASISCTWQTILHHNEHTHPEPETPGCTQPTVVTPVSCGDETYSYEFVVRVSDGAGLVTKKAVMLYPDCAPVPQAPTGAAAGNPKYVWKGARHADQYQLSVDDSSGANKINTTFIPAALGCTDPLVPCQIKPAVVLAAGAASFRVRAHNAQDGWRAWSAPLAFSSSGVEVRNLSVASVPSGLNVVVAGISRVAPFDIPVIKDSVVSVSALAQGAQRFVSWSDGGAATHDVTMSADLNLTVTFEPDPSIGTGLLGEYFSGTSFGTRLLARVDPSVDFDWGTGSPAGQISNDLFSVRWRGEVRATTTGQYTFLTDSDDGVRLWVNGQQILSNWSDHAPVTDTGTITLQAGQRYPITLEYYEGGFDAIIRLRWTPPGQATQVIPTLQLFPLVQAPQAPVANAGSDQMVVGRTTGSPVVLDGTGSTDPNADVLTFQWTQLSGPPVSLQSAGSAQATFIPGTVADPTNLVFRLTVSDGSLTSTDDVQVTVLPSSGGTTGDGLLGEYFNGRNFETPVSSRVDATINFNWLMGSPLPGVNIDNFSAKWTGDVLAPITGLYTFSTFSDDGVRLSVNGQQILNNWTDHAPITDFGSINLQAGQRYPIVLEFYEAGQGAQIRLSWTTPGSGISQVIPQTQLFAAPTVPRPPSANAGPDQSAPSGVTVTLDATGSTGPNNETLTYLWRQIGTPGVTLSGATGAHPAFVAPMVASPTTLTFELEVRDGGGLTDVDQVQVIVQPPASGGGAGTGLLGEYYNGLAFDTKVLSRVDPQIVFNWTLGSPAPGVNINQFSVRWSGEILATTSGSYTFETESDDGVRLRINNQLVINNWSVHGPTVDQGTITLQAGQRYPIVLEFFEDGSGAQVRLFWRPPAGANVAVPQANLFPTPVAPEPPIANAGPDQTGLAGLAVVLDGTDSSDPNNDPLTYQWTQLSGPNVTISNATSTQPTFVAPNVMAATPLTFRLIVSDGALTDDDDVQVTISPVSTDTGTGLLGEYFSGIAFNNLVTTRTDGTINFDWGSGSPAPGLNIDQFSVRWTGEVLAPSTGTYTFATESDDGVRLWVNGQQLVNNWNDHAPVINTGTIALQAGQRYAIVLEFYENAWGALAKLRWTPPGGGMSVIVPMAQLFPRPTTPQPPAVSAGPDQTVTSGATVALDSSGSTDPNNDPLTHQWTQVAGPAVTLGSTNSAHPTFMAPTVMAATTFDFEVTVSDGGLSATDQVRITVQAPIPGGGGTGLLGEYFHGIAFNTLVLTRTDPTVNFDWLSGSAAPSINIDAFSVRWSGEVQAVAAGVYTFATESDDGVRLWVNGQLLIDNWNDHAPVVNTGNITLQAGQRYTIVMEFYENAFGAVAKLRWTPPGGSNQVIPQSQLYPRPTTPLPPDANAGSDLTVTSGGSVTLDGRASSDPNNDPLTYQWTQVAGPAVTLTSASTAQPTFVAPSVMSPTTFDFELTVSDGGLNDTDQVRVTVQPVPAPGAGSGLRGRYYDGMNFGPLLLNRVDPTVDFNWGAIEPAPGLPYNFYSVRWSGEVLAPTTGVYTFFTDSDDGVRLRVNGQLIISNWSDHATFADYGTITLQAGQRYPIVLEYYENAWDAIIRLRWTPPGASNQVIPQSQLFPAP